MTATCAYFVACRTQSRQVALDGALANLQGLGQTLDGGGGGLFGDLA